MHDCPQTLGSLVGDEVDVALTQRTAGRLCDDEASAVGILQIRVVDDLSAAQVRRAGNRIIAESEPHMGIPRTGIAAVIGLAAIRTYSLHIFKRLDDRLFFSVCIGKINLCNTSVGRNRHGGIRQLFVHGLEHQEVFHIEGFEIVDAISARSEIEVFEDAASARPRNRRHRLRDIGIVIIDRVDFADIRVVDRQVAWTARGDENRSVGRDLRIGRIVRSSLSDFEHPIVRAEVDGSGTDARIFIETKRDGKLFVGIGFYGGDTHPRESGGKELSVQVVGHTLQIVSGVQTSVGLERIGLSVGAQRNAASIYIPQIGMPERLCSRSPYTGKKKNEKNIELFHSNGF